MRASKVNFKNRKHIHFTGIKGVGLTALAICARDLGIKVTGSDVEEKFVTDDTLKKAGISWTKDFGKKNLADDIDLIVTTGAHGGFSNLEVKAGSEMGIPVTSYAEALSDLTKSKELIAVCGVGGKTTTSSILSVVLDSAGYDPSFVVGVGEIFPIGLPGRYSKQGKYFISEADDYVVAPGFDNRPKFELFDPKIIVLTNIEHDHPDIYPSISDTYKAFSKFINKLPDDGMLVACIDNENVKKVIKDYKGPVLTYGYSDIADYKITGSKFEKNLAKFNVYHNNKSEEITIKVPGKYNILNSTAAYIVSQFIRISTDNAKVGLSKYRGCKRRFEIHKSYKGATFVDDYAHHPEEIKSVLQAAKVWYPNKRLVAIFQPHTFSRTKVLFNDFVHSFTDADVLLLMDIYASARETKDESISSKKLADEIIKLKEETYYLGNEANVLEWIDNNIRENDVVLTIGAGDIFHLYDKMK